MNIEIKTQEQREIARAVLFEVYALLEDEKLKHTKAAQLSVTAIDQIKALSAKGALHSLSSKINDLDNKLINL